MWGCFDHKLQALVVLISATPLPYCETAGNGAFSNAAIKVIEDLWVCGNWKFLSLLRKCLVLFWSFVWCFVLTDVFSGELKGARPFLFRFSSAQ